MIYFILTLTAVSPILILIGLTQWSIYCGERDTAKYHRLSLTILERSAYPSTPGEKANETRWKPS